MKNRITLLITALIVSIGCFAQNQSKDEARKSQFAWGLDAGSAIDMTGCDMSAVDICGYLGYTGGYMRFLGGGAGIDMMVSSGSNVYPLFAILRTDFSNRPRLLFMDLRGGIAFCNIENYAQQCNPYGSLGLGVTLAKGKTFSSHVILSYNYTRLNDVHLEERVIKLSDLQYACIRIGISF